MSTVMGTPDDPQTRQRAGRLQVWRRLLWSVAVLLFGMGSGVALDREYLGRLWPGVDVPPRSVAEFRLIAEAWNTIDRRYVDRATLQPRSLAYGAISGMIAALGDTGHSTFLRPEMAKTAADVERGSYQGIGLEISKQEGRVVVTAPLDGSPAQRARLSPGDVILDVDGQDVTGKPLAEVVGRLAGPPGTSVTLRLLSPGVDQVRTLTLERTSIMLHSVTWQKLPGTRLAHVRIARFSRGVTADLRQALEVIAREHLAGVILDLRDDPGGLLDEAVGVTSQFVDRGAVLLERKASGETRALPVRPDGIALTVPLAVLINAGTASAAEIVAAALKDAGRAELVGQPSYGTGTILGEFPLSDGSAIMLAIGEWLTPNGSVIWHRGVPPDRVVELASGVRPSWPEDEGTLSEEQLTATHDHQLFDAIQVLGRRVGRKDRS